LGTFTTGINLYERVLDKAKQSKKDAGQDARITELQKKLDEKNKAIERPERPERRSDQVHDSLSRGGPIVGREYERNFARMGPRFAQGDGMNVVCRVKQC
jgi:hypothetical protein